MPATKAKTDDPDDIFADSRMSFGDHLEELRSRMFKAFAALAFFMIIGFVLDGVGSAMKWDNFGVGRPVFRIMTRTVENQVRDFYNKRNEENVQKMPKVEITSKEEADRIAAKLKANDYEIDSLTGEEREKLLGVAELMTMHVPKEQLEKTFDAPLKPGLADPVPLQVMIYPAQLNYLNVKGEGLTQNKKYLTSLSVQEPFVVYFKVSLICGFVLGSPWIFYQAWAFVAAGLYPHEKRHVYVYMPASIFLFLSGVALCQLVVLPSAVKALLGFNEFLDVDPDIRLNEWLGFAIILPLVFGISFQTPLVMVFLNRIGTFTWEDYWAYWRIAVMVLAVFSALITPTPDAVTMSYLFLPMFALYMLGIAICKYFPPSHERFLDDDADQVAV